jgi:hypothetical protein
MKNTSTEFKRAVRAMQGAGYKVEITGDIKRQVLYAYPPSDSGYNENRWMALFYGTNKEFFYPQIKKKGSPRYSTVKNRVSADTMVRIISGEEEFSFG